MNADWDSAIAFTLKMEGGDVAAENNPADPGGLTKFGISQKAYPSLDIPNLTLEDAKKIYRRDYWEACRCDELPPALAVAVFDTAVNQGTGKAKRLLQIALDVDVDGVIGDKTISAAFHAPPSLVKKFLAHRMAEYARLMAENKALLVFAVNWSYRVLRLADLVTVK
jgi:lysozyme family protein